jgi:hypothetical protein
MRCLKLFRSASVNFDAPAAAEIPAALNVVTGMQALMDKNTIASATPFRKDGQKNAELEKLKVESTGFCCELDQVCSQYSETSRTPRTQKGPYATAVDNLHRIKQERDVRLTKAYGSRGLTHAQLTQAEEDYNSPLLTEAELLSIAKQLLSTMVSATAMTAHDEEPIKIPEVTLGSAWFRGAECIVLPSPSTAAQFMLNGGFCFALAHELAHGIKDMPAYAEEIRELKKAAEKVGNLTEREDYAYLHPDRASWIDECIADLTGMLILGACGEISPSVDSLRMDLNFLRDEGGDHQHPPGSVRLKLIEEVIYGEEIA